MNTHRTRWIALVALASACAGSAPPPPAKPATPAPAVDPLAAFALPELPFDGDAASIDFRRGHERAVRFLQKSVPEPPQGVDLKGYQAWMQTQIVQWLTDSAAELNQIQRALAPVAEGDPREAVVAATLVALCWQRVHDHFVALPPPPGVEDDPEQQAAFRDGLEQAAMQWLLQAAGTFEFCASRAKGEALAAWKAYCTSGRDAASARMEATREKLAKAIEAQAEAARGPRPPGADACWTPSQGRGPAGKQREPETPAPAMVAIDPVEPSRVPLLGRERERVSDALRAKLAAMYAEHAIQVQWLDGKRIAALTGEWKRGQQVSGDRRCARGIEQLEFLRRSHPNLELANAWASCDDAGCTLQVDLGDHGAASVLGSRRLRAPLPEPLSDPEHWLQAVEALAPVESKDAAVLLDGLSGRFRATPGEPLTLHRFELHGAWQDAEAARATLEASALTACAGPEGLGRDVMAVLDVDASGRVRDVWQPPTQSAEQKEERCLAKALAKLQFAPGEGVRRIGLTASLGRGLGQSARDAAYGAIDMATDVRVSIASAYNLTLSPAPLHDAVTQSRLAACFARHAVDAAIPAQVRATVSVSPTGKPQKASIEPLAETAPNVELERCLARELGRIDFDCSLDAKPAQVEATICMVKEPTEAADDAPAPAPADASAEDEGG